MNSSQPHAKVQAMRRSPLLRTGILLSLVPPVAVGLILQDNPSGFRSADDMVDLIGMMFSALALPWLVIAVLLQKTELGLQREELSLQRAEVARLVDETKHQVSLMRDQLILQSKSTIAAEFRSFLEAELENMVALAERIRDTINDIANELSEFGDAETVVARRYGSSQIRAIVTNESTGAHKTVRVRYVAVAARIGNDPRLLRGWHFWSRCQKLGLGQWYRDFLPHSVAPVGTLTVYQIMAFAGVSARARAAYK